MAGWNVDDLYGNFKESANNDRIVIGKNDEKEGYLLTLVPFKLMVKVTVLLDNGKAKTLKSTDLPRMDLSYGINVHRSQGMTLKGALTDENGKPG